MHQYDRKRHKRSNKSFVSLNVAVDFAMFFQFDQFVKGEHVGETCISVYVNYSMDEQNRQQVS